MTQKEQVLSYIRQNGSITSWEAISAFKLTRLAAIIKFLKKDGHKFDTKRERHPETGKPYARYSFQTGQQTLNLDDRNPAFDWRANQ